MLRRLNRLGDRNRKVSLYDFAEGSDPVDFLGKPDATSASPESIIEQDLVRIAMSKEPVREAFAEALGIFEPVWMLLGEDRRRIFPDDPVEKPGDFDIIAGPLRDGRPALDTIAMVEVKRSPVRADGKPKSRPSGLGTTQARVGASLGFDRVLLAHFVVGPDESLRTPQGRVAFPEHRDVAERVLKTIRREDVLGPGRNYGTLVVEWARARGSNIKRTGSVAFLLGDSTPRLVAPAERRATLAAHLRAVLPTDNCPTCLWRCDACQRLPCSC